MSFLKKIPVRYSAELRNARLVNFSVPPAEVKSFLPAPLKPLLYDGRAIISLLDVEIVGLKPSFLLNSMSFNYRHVAFRILVDNIFPALGNEHQGIYNLSSYTNKPLIVQAGRMMTDYNFHRAHMHGDHKKFWLIRKNNFLNYILNYDEPVKERNALTDLIAGVDKTYSVQKGEVMVTPIKTNLSELQEINCARFETNFFKSVRLENACFTQETVPFNWVPSETSHFSMAQEQPMASTQA